MRPLVLLALLLLGGCNDDLVFSPKLGDEQSYQVVTSTLVKPDGHYPSQHVDSQSLVRYRVTETGKVLRFDIANDYMALDASGQGRLRSNQPSSGDKEWRQLMAAGFELAVDANSGALVTLKGHDQALWQKALERGGSELIRQLRQGMAVPGFVSAIPATPGATLALPDIQGHRATLTVDEVTPGQLSAHFSAEAEQARLYGRLQFDRKTTWLTHMALVMEAPFERFGITGQLRTLMVMAPKGSSLASLSYRTHYQQRDDEPFAIPTPPEQQSHAPATDHLYAEGYIDRRHDDLRLSYFLPGNPDRQELALDNIEALDASGQVIKDALLVQERSRYPLYGDIARIDTSLARTGWQENPTAIASIRADAKLYATTVRAKSLTLQPGKSQQLSLGGQTLTLSSPPNAPLELTLSHTNTATSWLLGFDGLQGTMNWQNDTKSLPDWLQPVEKEAIASIAGQGAEHLVFHLDKAPGQVTFYVLERSPEPVLRREVSFVSPNRYLANPHYPPPEALALFEGSDSAPLEPALHLDKGQGLLLTLPTAWQPLCKLSLDKGFSENGHPVTWQAATVPEPGYLGFAAPGQQMVLATDDGKRRYFYGQSVTTRLDCAGTPGWQPLAFSADPASPWLVKVEGLDGNATVEATLARLQLLDDEGRPLALLDGHSGMPAKPGDTLASIGVDGYLRVAGLPVKARQLVVAPAPYQRQWTTDFPPLP